MLDEVEGGEELFKFCTKPPEYTSSVDDGATETESVLVLWALGALVFSGVEMEVELDDLGSTTLAEGFLSSLSGFNPEASEDPNHVLSFVK